jgi:two-component system NtrC family sensor kinase
MVGSSGAERILIIDNDPITRDLIAKQALIPGGYQVRAVDQIDRALNLVQRFNPHLIICRLMMPDLTGKDLMVALSSLEQQIPVIMIGEQGTERDAIETFRLGATDFLPEPLRETEIIAAAERALRTTRARRAVEAMSNKLKSSYEELKRQSAGFAAVLAIGKTVSTAKNTRLVLHQIAEGALQVSGAERSWLLLRLEDSDRFVLAAQRHLPTSIARRVNQAWDDGISAIVAASGEPLSMSGRPLKQFPIWKLGGAIYVQPIKAQNETIGLISVMRRSENEFDRHAARLLDAVADYAAIALVNARLFQALDRQLVGEISPSS